MRRISREGIIMGMMPTRNHRQLIIHHRERMYLRIRCSQPRLIMLIKLGNMDLFHPNQMDRFPPI